MLLGLTALILATLFAGAALYITLVEQPARLMLDDGPMLAQWQPSYKRALPIQAGLAVLGGVAGLIVWFEASQWQWLAGAILLLANWPFTMLGILPTNKRLMAMQPAAVGAEARRLLLRWGRLHSVRSALGSLAALTFAWALLVA
ncbi:MAG: DUF1772 domain-containing protein [Sphingomonas sp.]|nr:DUF1772 domain-containing protein [Sphingomonas sp.]